MSDSPETSVILVGLVFFLAVVGLMGNLLVVLIVWRNPSLHGLTNYLLLNLAVADGLVCGTGILGSRVYLVYRSCEEDKDEHLGLFLYMYLHRATAGQSVLSLLLVTFERFVGIVHPLHHRGYFSKLRMAALLLLVWLVPPIAELPVNMWFFAVNDQTELNCTLPDSPTDPEAGPEIQPVLIGLQLANTVLFFTLPASAMVWMYARILRSLRTSARELEARGVRGPPRELHRASGKVARVLLLVNAAFVLLILPDKVVSTVITARYRPGTAASLVPVQATHFLTVANSAVNPVLYGLSYDKFRGAVRSAFCRRSNANAIGPRQPTCDVISVPTQTTD